MVWTNNVGVVIMLCALFDRGRVFLLLYLDPMREVLAKCWIEGTIWSLRGEYDFLRRGSKDSF